MKVILIKSYAFGVKKKDVGTIAEVTQGLGEELISKGIAKEYKGEVVELPKIKKKESTNKENKSVILPKDNNQVEKPDTKDK